MKHTDVAIVGAGIVGIAHAYHAARAGLSVAVFERDALSQRASVQNFGMLAIIAQKEGRQLDAALRSLECWQNIAVHADVQLEQTGCLFLAREQQELAVLQEYISSGGTLAAKTQMVCPKDLYQYAPDLRMDNLQGAMWSPDAWKVDQRQACAGIASWLQREYGVTFYYSTQVESVVAPQINTSIGPYSADNVIVCGGSEFQTLFPEAFAACDIVQCELQMLRTRAQPPGWQLKPFILGGLSMSRYSAFSECASLADLVAMQQQRFSEHLSHGIHVIACQEADGTITIGDSHRYGTKQDCARSVDVDRLMLEELAGMIALPKIEIEQRWIGRYAFMPDTEVFQHSPADNVTVVTVTNGQGMTHGFSVAEAVIAEFGGS